ncbi:hypothetical protein JCM17844_03000 [Iodidimonas gelatinilytica]|uniref:thiazole synthase n=1 Tax=Iodidimonas gelatinilytica TaxID=1236966 RepID=A0A5A7MNE2_9PROT|nr:hypothetical protein JCM17844_03000 [Iodidimonas gelatinilytica]
MITVSINGENRSFDAPLTARGLLDALSLDPRKVALERNREIVPKSMFDDTQIVDGDQLEIVHFVGGGQQSAVSEGYRVTDPLQIAGKTYGSRLIVGTGKYRDFEQTAEAVAASGAEIVTVAVRRVNVSDPDQPMLTDYLDPKSITYLPNTAGCFTADDALRTLRLAREAGGWDLVKLEVLGDKATLYPDMRETLKAAEVLISEGFKVMVYTSDDPLFARELNDMGCVASCLWGLLSDRDWVFKIRSISA